MGAMVYGYCRLSTKHQAKNGYGLEVQEQEIIAVYPAARIYKEPYGGASLERPHYEALLGRLKKGDTLCVTTLDRLARNTPEGIGIIENLFKKGVAVHVLNIGLLKAAEQGPFFLTVLRAVSEMERASICERTQIGKEIAKMKEGFREGRPRTYTNEQLSHAMNLLEQYSYKMVSEMTKISQATLARERRRRRLQADAAKTEGSAAHP